MIESQRMSFWPAWPLPVAGQPLTESGPHPCAYLPERPANIRAFAVSSMAGSGYQAYMDAGFRRSGRMIYQPICPGCRSCVPLRVEVEKLRWTKSLRRVLKRNADLRVGMAPPAYSSEKWELYRRYQREWHRKPADQTESFPDFVRFLYDSPVDTVEFEYRGAGGRLIGVGLCDRSAKSLSSVYFYFDPAESGRSPGTFSALYEMLRAREMGIPYWYSGYWVRGCGAMEYKSRFRPCEFLGTDNVWRVLEG